MGPYTPLHKPQLLCQMWWDRQEVLDLCLMPFHPHQKPERELASSK